MKISDYSFHDATILHIREYPEVQTLEFHLDFPVNWENNQFEFRILKLTNVTYYSFDTIPFSGNPTILDIIELESTTKNKIEVVTNAGKRIIEYLHSELLEQSI